MNVKICRELAQMYTEQELNKFADEFEVTGIPPIKTQDDAGKQMSDYLQAAEIRSYIDQGMNVNEAIREFSKRIRGVLR